jgi:hypothetical protein
MRITLSMAAVALAAVGLSAQSQTSFTKSGEMLKATATIQQIDSTHRIITFKNEDGTEDSVYAGPEVKRFDELKVGDKVTLTYYETTFFKIRKPGDPPLDMKSDTAVTGTSGALPGATVANQTVKTVTVKSVDPTAGVITVTTSDGRVITRKVDEKVKPDLANIKAGDQIDIVYTEAMLASVERGS